MKWTLAGVLDSDMVRSVANMTVLVSVALVLGSCALPPALSIASLMVDGVSYAASGKSVQDHALSAATDEDCALWRAVKGVAICREKDGGADSAVAGKSDAAMDETAIAPELLAARAESLDTPQPIIVAQLSLPPLSPLGKVAAPISAGNQGPIVALVPPIAVALSDAKPVNTATSSVAETPIAPTTAQAASVPLMATQPAMATNSAAAKSSAAPIRKVAVASPHAKDRQVLVVLASFNESFQAVDAARSLARLSARVIEGQVHGRVVHRVVAGPYTSVQAVQIRRAARSAGVGDSWLLGV
ncbi:MAG: hypothetical protein ACKVSF_10560 [Alphaproteobacteria bacterium]